MGSHTQHNKSATDVDKAEIYTTFGTRTISLVLSSCLIWRVGGEFDRVLEVEMYGSRPGNVDSLVVPSRDYYKYEELSDNNIEEKVTGETTQSAEEEALAGYQKKVSG